MFVFVELTSSPCQSQGAGQNEKVLIDTWSEEQMFAWGRSPQGSVRVCLRSVVRFLGTGNDG